MRDIVIVPVYERPEFAIVCLEYLSKAYGVHDKEIWLRQDQHIGGPQVKIGEMMEVVDYGRAAFGKNFNYGWQEAHNYYGNSYNLLESMKEAYEAGADRVFLVEDDIMVAPDIFLWHEAVLKQVDPFVSCATAVNKSAHFEINGRYVMDESFKDPAAYYVSETAYSSHASAFRRDYLREIVERFADHSVYVDCCSGKEQDLLIQGFIPYMSRTGCGSVWPYVLRAFNVGIYSYHTTGMKFGGTFEEKVSALRATIKDPAKLRDMSSNNQAVTAVPEWLRLSECEWGTYTDLVYNAQKYK